MYPVQRKFRNKEERVQICSELATNLHQMGVDPEYKGIVELMQVLEKFVSQEHGGVLQGTIPLPELKAQIVYYLPGRRVERHSIRIKRDEEK